MKMNENEHVKTAIRWRLAEVNENVILEKVSQNILSVGKQNRTFMFDHIIDSSSQEEIYNILVKPLIDSAFKGYDCTFLASGQTGSGKTYTIGFENQVNSENNGVAARVLNSIFTYKNVDKMKLLVSFIEVYNDQAFDLLGSNPQQPFHKKDHRLSDATKKSVKNESEVLVLLQQGTQKRRVRGTKMNPISSRSHAVFTIILGIEHEPSIIRESVINLVDLAGSEGFHKTGNTGTATVEGKCINESLSAFKRVISAMSRGDNYIPYRDSVITTLLRNSLKTNCYLTLLGCVSPYQSDYGETLTTLSFVSEAKLIKKTPQLNAIISEFQKSRTPVKLLPQTPKPALVTPLRRALLSSSFQNSRPLGQRSEPRQSSFRIPNQIKHIDGKPTLNSTTKKTFPSNIRKTKRSFSIHRNLFPTTKTREDIEASIADSTFDGTFNINEVSSSSRIDHSHFGMYASPRKTSHQPKKPQNDQPAINQFVEQFRQMLETTDVRQNTKLQDLMQVLSEKMNQQPSKAVESSFVPVPTESPMLSTVDENECTEDNSGKESVAVALNPAVVLDPIGDQEQDQAQNIGNLLVQVDHEAKTIVVEVPTVEVRVPSPIIQQQSMIRSPDIPKIISSDQQIDEKLDKKSQTEMEIDQNQHSASEAVISSTAFSSPDRVTQSDRRASTPIGVLRLRKCFPKMTENEDTVYEVVTVDRKQSNPDVYHWSPTQMIQNISYSLPNSPAVASKSSSKYHRFPVSPRIILHRIDSLQDYYRLGAQNPVGTPAPSEKNRRRSQRLKSARKKVCFEFTDNAKGSKPSPTLVKSNLMQNILRILNKGTEKDLQTLQMIGKKKANQIFIYSNDPFLVISRSNEDGSYSVVIKTDPAPSTQNPAWRPFTIRATTLCNGDFDRNIKIDCYDHRSNGNHKLIGTCYTNLRSLSQNQPPMNLVNEEKKKSHPNHSSDGVLRVAKIKITEDITFLDYIRNGTQMHFAVAIDFTASNGVYTDPKSLHYLSNHHMNQYEIALRAVGEIIQYYDNAQLFPAFGFGAKLPPSGHVSHQFPLNGNPSHPYCSSVAEILTHYRKQLRNVTLYGPTNFSPVITNTTAIARQFQDGRHYFVLLIITDGIISDMQQTKRAIIEASGLPLSIIIVGVGDADFDAMDELDSDDVRLAVEGRYAERDIVQFVPLNKFQFTVFIYTFLNNLPRNGLLNHEASLNEFNLFSKRTIKFDINVDKNMLSIVKLLHFMTSL